MRTTLHYVAVALIMVSLGLATGYYAASQTHSVDETHAEPADDAGGEMEFDAQALANLGVRVAKVTAQKPRRTYRVQGLLENTPASRRTITSPFAGHVVAIGPRLGSVIDDQTVVISVLRDRLPPFEPKRAATILQPVNEELHASYMEIMRASKRAQILREELTRLEGLDARSTGDTPLVSKQELIDLRNELRRAATELESIEHKLEAHGVKASEIARILEGGHPPHGASLWKRALEHHGLWTTTSDQIHELLPATTRNAPQTVAALGELAASSLVDLALVEAVGRHPAIRKNFIDFTRLRLDGYSVERLEAIAERGGMSDRMELRVPRTALDTDDSRWDLEAYEVGLGEHVVAGQSLATVRNSEEMLLVMTPVGDEVAALRRLLATGGTFRAQPLVADTGPVLTELSISGLGSPASRESNRDSHTALRAFAVCENEVLAAREGGSRTWALLPGTRYVAQIELEREGEPLYVLPHDAVVSRGSTRVVYVLEAGHPHAHTVKIVDRDDDSAYIARDAFEDGATVIIRGALQLSLALERSSGADAHAGHTH